MINKKLKLVSLCLLAAISLSNMAHTKLCTGSGFGISLGANFSKPTVKFKINRKFVSASIYEYLKALLKKELADSNISAKKIGFSDGNDGANLNISAVNTRKDFGKLLENDENSIKTYPKISGSNWTNNILIIKDNDDCYIRSSEVENSTTKTDDEKAKDDIALSDVIDNSSLIDSTIKDSCTYKDVSKCQFAIDLGAFYNIKIYDWIIRPEIDFSIPVSNRTIKLENSSSDNDNQQTNNNTTSGKNSIEFTKSFDIKLKLLGGYHITERFKVLLGVGAVYSRYKLKANIVNPFSTNTTDNDSKVLSYAWNEASKAISSNYNTTQTVGKWNVIGTIELEFNLNQNNIISANFSFMPSKQITNTTSDAKSLGDLTFSNTWTGGIAYKFIF